MNILLKPSEFLKARKLPEGTVRDWKGKKYKKTAGKWVPYKEGGKKKDWQSYDKILEQAKNMPEGAFSVLDLRYKIESMAGGIQEAPRYLFSEKAASFLRSARKKGDIVVVGKRNNKTMYAPKDSAAARKPHDESGAVADWRFDVQGKEGDTGVEAGLGAMNVKEVLNAYFYDEEDVYASVSDDTFMEKIAAAVEKSPQKYKEVQKVLDAYYKDEDAEKATHEYIDQIERLLSDSGSKKTGEKVTKNDMLDWYEKNSPGDRPDAEDFEEDAPGVFVASSDIYDPQYVSKNREALVKYMTEVINETSMGSVDEEGLEDFIHEEKGWYFYKEEL